MTSPAVGTGIVAFIEARLDEWDAKANERLAGSAIFGMAHARRLLAEVAKDRAILALHRREADAFPRGDDCVECGRSYPCQTVRLLAAIDADHEAYRPEWKPVAG